MCPLVLRTTLGGILWPVAAMLALQKISITVAMDNGLTLRSMDNRLSRSGGVMAVRKALSSERGLKGDHRSDTQGIGTGTRWVESLDKFPVMPKGVGSLSVEQRARAIHAFLGVPNSILSK